MSCLAHAGDIMATELIVELWVFFMDFLTINFPHFFKHSFNDRVRKSPIEMFEGGVSQSPSKMEASFKTWLLGQNHSNRWTGKLLFEGCAKVAGHQQGTGTALAPPLPMPRSMPPIETIFDVLHCIGGVHIPLLIPAKPSEFFSSTQKQAIWHFPHFPLYASSVLSRLHFSDASLFEEGNGHTSVAVAAHAKHFSDYFSARKAFMNALCFYLLPIAFTTLAF